MPRPLIQSRAVLKTTYLAIALPVRLQVNLGSSRPKWPKLQSSFVAHLACGATAIVGLSHGMCETDGCG